MERAVPILPADDLGVAKAFYVDGLGFRVSWEATADGRTGLMGVDRGGITLTIDAPMSGHGRQACVSLRVDDADAYYQEWRHKVPAVTPPRDEEWGARTFGVTDPSGNTIFVIGPRGGQAAAPGPKARSLVPLAHVRDVPRSVAFYQLLGFDVANTHTPDGGGDLVWAWLRSGDAHLMLARVGEPIVAPQPATLFYLYCDDVEAFRTTLLERGVDASPVAHPFYAPRGEFRVTDPDGHMLMVSNT